MVNNCYILITPSKNEEESLPMLITSIINQEIKPAQWFIVDDGSIDNSYQIIKQASKEYRWIKYLRLESNRRYDIEEHYSNICKIGFDSAIDHCNKYKIDYDFIALSDADAFYDSNYFRNLIDFLNINNDYGIVSGQLLIKTHSKGAYCESKVISGLDYPYGTGRLWRRKAFEETDGYLCTKSPDLVSNVMAIQRGWSIKQVKGNFIYQTRETGSKIDLWSGYFSNGKRAHYVGSTPLNIIFNVLYILFISGSKNSAIKSLAFFCGYGKSYVLRERRLENDQVRNHIGNNKVLLNHIMLYIKTLFSRKRWTLK